MRRLAKLLDVQETETLKLVLIGGRGQDLVGFTCGCSCSCSGSAATNSSFNGSWTSNNDN